MLTRRAIELIRFLVDAPAAAALAVVDEAAGMCELSAGARQLLGAAPGDSTSALAVALRAAADAWPPDADATTTVPLDVAGRRFMCRVQRTSTSALGPSPAFVLRIEDPRSTDRDGDIDRWRVAAEVAGDGVWDREIEAGKAWLSPRWKQIIGYAPHELGDDDREWGDRVHPDDAAGLRAALQRHWDGIDPVYANDHRLRHRDGSWVWYRGRGVVVERAADGRPRRMVGTGTVVTAEHEHNARARLESWVLGEALRIAHAGSWAWYPAEDRQEVSAEFCALFGCTPEDMLGPLGRGRRFVTEESFARIRAARARALETGEPYEIDVEGIHADGRRLHLQSRAAPLRLPDTGELVLVGVAIDVTAQREADAALRANADLLARMSALADVGGWRYDVPTGVLAWTEQTWRIHGLPPAVAPPVAEAVRYYPGEAADTIAALFQRAVAEGQPYEVELPFVDARGHERWVRTSGVPDIRDGRCVGVHGAIQDITAAKQQELELIARGVELARRNEALEALATATAHDLKEPVRRIETLLDMALQREGGVDAQAAALVGRARASAARLNSLTDDLLAVTRAGSMPLERRSVDLDALLADLLGVLDEDIRAAGVAVECERLGSVEGDPRLLRQALHALLDNAIKFRDPARPARVRVGCVPGDDTAQGAPRRRIVVEDNGIGFEPRYALQIMQPFRRLHPQGRFQGNGIGLALAKRIVERHGGSLSADGQAGQGARFLVELPGNRGLRPGGTPGMNEVD